MDTSSKGSETIWNAEQQPNPAVLVRNYVVHKVQYSRRGNWVATWFVCLAGDYSLARQPAVRFHQSGIFNKKLTTPRGRTSDTRRGTGATDALIGLLRPQQM